MGEEAQEVRVRHMKWLILALTLAFGLMGAGLLHQNTKISEQRATIQTLADAQKQAQEREKKLAKALVARDLKIDAQTRKLQDAQSRLSKALQANKSWSDTDVPDDVQKALQRDSGGPAYVP